MKKLKNKLKKASLFVIALCVILCSCPFLLNNFSYISNSSVIAETIPDSEEESQSLLVNENDMDLILENVAISIPSYNFTSLDLSTIIQEQKEYSCFYTNKAVTISTTSTFTTDDKLTVKIKNDPNTDITSNCLVQVGDKFYYNLKPSNNQDNIYHIEIQLQKYFPATSSSRPSTKTVTVVFYIMQTYIDFYANSQIKWAYEQSGLTYNITEPSNGKQYNSSLRVFVPGGSIFNPIYLNFEYLGQTYNIYKIEDKYYNSVDNSEIDLPFINFSKSGIYNVSIYDRTYISKNPNNPNNNYQKFNFIIKNSVSPFYIVAKDQQNNMLADGEYTNDTVKVDFCNLENIIHEVGTIEVSRSYSPSSGVNIPETTVYNKSQISSNFSLNFDKSGTYHIYVKDNTKYKNTIYSHIVVVLKDIMTSFTIGQTTYTVDESIAVNKTKTELLTLSKSFNFNEIVGTTQFSFNIFLANSSPAIVGIENNTRTSDPVNLRVYGVGNISVKITHNGQTQPEIIRTDGQYIGTILEKGKYFVQITDQMGNTRNVSFNVTIKLNTSSIVLIGVAAAAVVGLVVFLIISRSKVKVR